jgi:hypothetical protein
MADRLVTIATYRFPAEAEAARMFLEADGIQAFLADNETVAMDWLLGNAIGHVKLQVADGDASRAATILRDLAERKQLREEIDWHLDEDEDAPLNCLSCGKPMPDEAETCPACGWSYESDSET